MSFGPSSTVLWKSVLTFVRPSEKHVPGRRESWETHPPSRHDLTAPQRYRTRTNPPWTRRRFANHHPDMLARSPRSPRSLRCGWCGRWGVHFRTSSRYKVQRRFDGVDPCHCLVLLGMVALLNSVIFVDICGDYVYELKDHMVVDQD